MIARDGQRIVLDGAVTMATCTALRESAAPLLRGAAEVDWTAVEQVDSSAVSLVLAWQREGHALAHRNLPDGLIALADLYGVKEMLAR